MNNNLKGNQKHLTLSQRIEIEKGLLASKSFASIAKEIGKDPSTISKEVRKNAKISERKNMDFAPIPCALRKNCKLMYLCDSECGTQCKMCKKVNLKCINVCPSYQPVQCEKLQKPPYICNGCGKRINCLMEKKIYSSKHADDSYREVLVSRREGINQTPERIQKINDILTPLIKNGQSIAHIYANHAEELGCSRRTIYSYIDSGIFEVRNIDMRRTVKYKKRRKATQCSTKDRIYREGRNYEQFQELLKATPPYSIVEMDTVEGRKGGKVFLTMIFRNCRLMLIFILESKTQLEVKRVFDELTEILGIELFHRWFEVILTDGGSEFQNPYSLEYTEDGMMRCNVYFCNPYSSWQKGMIEKNHEYIRYVLPKGTSFDELTPEKTTLLMNHINSETRDSLNSHTPFELSQFLLDKKVHDGLGLKAIKPDDVKLIPALLK